MEPLISSEELAEIRTVGESMMTTSIEILRGAKVEVGDAGYDPSYAYGDALSQYDYGDDAFFPEATVEQLSSLGLVDTVDGWFVSRLQNEVQTGTGEIATIDLHVVRLPVGTDVRPEDAMRVVSTQETYLVVDVNDDDTWPEWLKAIVRRAE